MRARNVAISTTLALFGMGCSSGIGTSTGSGSGTLRVDAEVSVTNMIDNATLPSQFRTELSVRVEKAGAEVRGAVVTLGTGPGELVLVEDGQNNGRYKGSENGYGARYSLSVRIGDDYVEGITLDGPDVHSFDAPAIGAQVPAGQPLEVRWSPSGADSARLDTKELDDVSISDTGSYSVPGTALKGDNGKPVEDRVRLTRQSTVTITGGTAGSSLEVSLRNELPFLVL